MSNIIYAPTSWNPISGCSPVSEGCENCWASTLHNRRHAVNVKQAMIFAGLVDEGERHIRGSEGWPQYVQRVGTPEEGWAVRGRKLGVRLPCPPQYDLPFAQVQTFSGRLDQPLHWRKPRMVAVAFMGDLFHERVPDEFIDKVFAVMALTPQHTYLLLTKRPERMRAYLNQDAPWLRWARAWKELTGNSLDLVLPWPLPNVWLGVSCENQARADERIPLLLETPAAHRWVSLEPLLGPVNLTPWLPFPCSNPLYHDPKAMRHPDQCYICEGTGMALHLNVGHGGLTCDPLDWLVIGGESGPHARPCDLGWIRAIRDQCKAAGTPCYVKQLGSVWRKAQALGYVACDSKGEDWDYWPSDLRVRETPEGSE